MSRIQSPTVQASRIVAASPDEEERFVGMYAGELTIEKRGRVEWKFRKLSLSADCGHEDNRQTMRRNAGLVVDRPDGPCRKASPTIETGQWGVEPVTMAGTKSTRNLDSVVNRQSTRSYEHEPDKGRKNRKPRYRDCLVFFALDLDFCISPRWPNGCSTPLEQTRARISAWLREAGNIDCA